LLKINESSVQPGRVAWLNGARCVLQVPEDEHGLMRMNMAKLARLIDL